MGKLRSWALSLLLVGLAIACVAQAAPGGNASANDIRWEFDTGG